ncbi:cation/H(+) antiporter 2-like [Lolium rigidum]|uniref:cation/H(+) antiporter 2-like n=1 Tax=Lolium rigidum TaxID=89674 RepID=UPI001F5C2E05|nr:cation/H(+) antiporter 2-like [Lolium rigidum]
MSDMAEDGEAKCSADVAEGSYFMAGVLAILGLMAAVLVLSGLFHSVLRRVGQPSIISHILAGVVVGPTVLGRMVDLRQLGMKDAGRALGDAIYYIRVVFMFFIGLEMDLRYLRRHLRASIIVAFGGSALCLVLATISGPFFYGLLHPGQRTFQPESLYASTALFMLVLTSTASPVLIRIVTELKITGSETGQLAIGTAFANDIASLAAISMMVVSPTTYDKDGKPLPPPNRLVALPVVKVIMFLWMALNVWVSVRIMVWMTRLVNKTKQGKQYISKYELFAMLVLIVGLSQHVQLFGYSASMTAFIIGITTPREGPTARTLIDRLAYPVHSIIMPLCFSTIGARLDFAKINCFTPTQFLFVVTYTTLLSTIGRVVGTVVAGRMIGIPARETLVLGFLLNVKGYADILAINLGDSTGIWNGAARGVLLLSSIITTFMAGPASAAIVRQQRRAFQYRSHCLQHLKLDQELRVLVCVHGAGSVHSMLTLAELSKGATPVAIYLLHLIELMSSRKYAITHFYHTGDGADEEDDDSGRWGYAPVIDQVVAAVNGFTNGTFIPVRQMTAISSLETMDADVCNGAEDARASLVVVPFHKEQRYDGRMVCRHDNRRELNQRILQRAPCTVGVLVERHDPAGETHSVVAVFLGGPDDREAVAYATRLAAHPSVSVMVTRFLPAGASVHSSTEKEEEAMADEEFMADFYARFVAPGHVSYTERYVSNGPELVESLCSMAGMYSLFVVGKGADGGSAAVTQMTSGMGGLYEECPELGHVGDLLSSDDLSGCCASVLVLRQHNVRQRMKQDPNGVDDGLR